MFSSALLLLCLFAHLSLFGSVSGSPALEEAYGAVVSVVSPGQQLLTGDSLRSLFNTLENRVQCGEVSCEKVSFIRLFGSQVRARWQTPCVVERGRCPKAVTQEMFQLLLNLIRLFLLLYHINSAFMFKQLMEYKKFKNWIHPVVSILPNWVPPKMSKSQMSLFSKVCLSQIIYVIIVYLIVVLHVKICFWSSERSYYAPEPQRLQSVSQWWISSEVAVSEVFSAQKKC